MMCGYFLHSDFIPIFIKYFSTKTAKIETVLSITLVAGGYPLFVNGKIAGAIGVGGGTEAQDCAIAEHVVAVFKAEVRLAERWDLPV